MSVRGETGGMRGVLVAGVLLAVAALVVVATVVAPSVAPQRTIDDQALRERGVYPLQAPRPIEPFELRDHEGAPFTKASFEGRWTFVYFGFTHCPDLCPVAMSVLAQVERRLQHGEQEDGDRGLQDAFKAVLVTVDPQRDDPERLRRYLEEFSPRFTGVIGERTMLARLARALDVHFEQAPPANDSAPADYLVDHTTHIAIVNPEGEYHGFIAAPYDAGHIEEAYRAMARRF